MDTTAPTDPSVRPPPHDAHRPQVTPVASGAGRLPRLQEAGLLVVILFLGAVLTGFGYANAPPDEPNTFLNADNLVNGVATPMSIYAIMAIGVTFVILTGGIDISVGSIFALSALATAWVLQYQPRDAPAYTVLPIAFGVALGVGLVCGLFNGALVVGLRMHPFIVTLGTMSIYRGIAIVAPPYSTLPAAGRKLPDAFTTGFMRWEVGGLRLMPMVVMLVCAALGWFYLRMTVAGRENYAVGGNEEASRFSGIRVGRVKLRVYALSGLAAGVAGLVSLGRFGTASTNLGIGYELAVIAAAVVGGASLTGGRGTAIGAVLGALVIRLISNGIEILDLNQEYASIIIGAAIIIAVAIDRLSEYVRDRRLRAAAAAARR